ncbi:MAG: hypothetical protein AAF385_09115 [Pseudomonadota bacterium]
MRLAFGLGLMVLAGCKSLAAQETGRLENPLIVEASGLANSAFSPSRYWTLNDGGNAPILYALGSKGEHLGSLKLSGVDNVDWEDLGVFDIAGERYLVVADIGDNAGKRESVSLHLIKEPEELNDSQVTMPVDASLRFRYPDGPRDAEALAVSGDYAYVLSKRTRPPVLYRLPIERAFDEAPNTPLVAERLGTVETLPKPTAAELTAAPLTGVYAWQPTAMSIRHDGTAAVILTTRNAYVYKRNASEDWLQTFAQPPQVRALSERLDAESVCFSPNGKTFLTTTEAKHAALFFHTLDE